MIDIQKFRQQPLSSNPYEHVIVRDFIEAGKGEALIRDYPAIPKPGSFPLGNLQYGPVFQELLDQLEGPEFRKAVEEKFAIDLQGKPTMVTVRGKCGTRDGNVHTDSESKLITLLLYLNDQWAEEEGGRLRLLRSNNLEDVAVEVPPQMGTLLVFKRSDTSWHGHKLFIGNRRVVQLNWVSHQKYVNNNYQRHGLSALLKKLNPFVKNGY